MKGGFRGMVLKQSAPPSCSGLTPNTNTKRSTRPCTPRLNPTRPQSGLSQDPCEIWQACKWLMAPLVIFFHWDQKDVFVRKVRRELKFRGESTAFENLFASRTMHKKKACLQSTATFRACRWECRVLKKLVASNAGDVELNETLCTNVFFDSLFSRSMRCRAMSPFSP